jgi:tetratricopeptide (TPR) repeat protein
LYPTVKAIASLAHCQGGRIDQGERDIEDALAACDELGVEERERCGVLNARAWVASIAGRYDDASEWIELSLASARATGDDNLLAGALTFRCANLAATRRDPAEARRLGDEALTLSLRLGNPTRIGFANLAQGMVRVAEDPEGSLSFFVDAAGAFEAVRDDAAVGACVACQAWISYESGDVQGATHLFASALDRFQRSGVPEILGGWLGFAALLLEAHGDDDTSAMLRGSRSVVAGRGVVPIVGDRLAASEDELRRRVGSDRHDAQVAAGRAMGPDELLTFVGQKFPLLVRDEAGP